MNYMENVYVGLKPAGTNNFTAKRPSGFDGIDAYLYYFDFDRYDELMTSDFKDISIDNAWDIAEQNTKENTFVCKLSSLTGYEDDEEAVPTYVVSNYSARYGAGGILIDSVRNNLAELLGTRKVFVIPSSVHELIVCPADDCIDADSLSACVRAFNAKFLRPDEILADHAFLIEL